MMSAKYETIDEYIRSRPKDVQPILKKMRQVIASAAPKAEEAMRYQMPTFRLNDKNLVHFAAWKTHIGFYPTPSVTGAFKKELSAFVVSKGAIQFPLDKPMPYALVKKIVRFRVKETL